MRQQSRYFITGAASGIGRQLTTELLSRGDRVFAADLDHEALANAARTCDWPADRVRLCRLDVRDVDEWEAVFAGAVAEFGRIDVLMNVAGVLRGGTFFDAPAAETHLQIDVNLKGVIFGTQVAARHMVARRGGHIVNFASMAGMAPIPGLAVYGGSKYGVRGFSQAAALELKQFGVSVTAICPDAVATALLDPIKDVDSAAIAFSSPRTLTVKEVTDAVLDRALRQRPFVLALPAGRGWLARIADLMPWTTSLIEPLMRKRGRRKQERMRRAATGEKK